MKMKMVGKVLDAEGKTLQLIALKDDTQYIVFTYLNSVQSQIDMRGFTAEQDMKDFIGRPIYECSEEEFNNTLFDLWGFGVKTYYVQGEENGNTQPDNGSSQVVVGEPEQSENAGHSIPENADEPAVIDSRVLITGNDDGGEQGDTVIAGDEQPIESAGSIDAEPVLVSGSGDRDDGDAEPEKAA